MGVVEHDDQRAFPGQMVKVICDRLLPNGQEPEVDVNALGTRRHLPQQLGLAETTTSDDHRDLSSLGVVDPGDNIVYELGTADEGLPVVEESMRRAAVVLLGRSPHAEGFEAQEGLDMIGEIGADDLMSGLGLEEPHQSGQVR